MRKVSTVAAKQSRNISQPKLTIGLDLGDRNSWYCMVDEGGQIRLEQRVRTNAGCPIQSRLLRMMRRFMRKPNSPFQRKVNFFCSI